MMPEIEPTNLAITKVEVMTNNPPPKQSNFEEALAGLPEEKRKRIERLADERKQHQASPRMELEMVDGALSVTFRGDNLTLLELEQMADIGTKDDDFRNGLIGQIACIGAQGRPIDNDNSNFIMAVVRSIKPRDELEAMLAVQMGAIHTASMMMARKLNNVTNLRQQDSAERTLNKLARTFTAQMDALKRYRTGGQQKVTVEHVTVNEGGQAIVGAVEAGGGGKK